jgi:hypothetical protein
VLTSEAIITAKQRKEESGERRVVCRGLAATLADRLCLSGILIEF